MEVMNLYLTLRYLRDEFKKNPSEELKEQILLTDKKLRDIENSLPIIYTQDELILTERDKQIFLDAINNPPKPNEELMKYKDIKLNNVKKKK